MHARAGALLPMRTSALLLTRAGVSLDLAGRERNLVLARAGALLPTRALRWMRPAETKCVVVHVFSG